MYQVKVHIEGVAPLRMNRFREDCLTGTSKKISEDDRVEDAYNRAYKDEKGYYIPRQAIKACLVEGGKKVKVGRGAASKLMKAIFHVNKEKVYLNGKSKADIMKDVVRIPPKTGGRVMQYWVYFPKWDIKFDATLVDDRFPVDAVENSFVEAGIYAGLLDGRPDFGRFVLKSFSKV